MCNIIKYPGMGVRPDHTQKDIQKAINSSNSEIVAIRGSREEKGQSAKTEPLNPLYCATLVHCT